MGLLLYKSDEMYSSTELIRKSKMIFNKVLDKEIDKAIILRDGKPCFLLMEFQKYEKIMAEYEELKEYVANIKNTKSKSTQSHKQKESNPTEKIKINEEDTQAENKNLETIQNTVDIKEPIKNTIPIQNITQEDKDKIAELKKAKELKEKQELEQLKKKESDKKDENTQNTDLSEEDEIKNAFDSIESMNFDDDMKKQAQEKIRAKILLARKERAKILADEDQNQQDLKEELILQRQLKEEKLKKDRELQEFWD